MQQEGQGVQNSLPGSLVDKARRDCVIGRNKVKKNLAPPAWPRPSQATCHFVPFVLTCRGFPVCESCSAVNLQRLLVWAGTRAFIAFDPKVVMRSMKTGLTFLFRVFCHDNTFQYILHVVQTLCGSLAKVSGYRVGPRLGETVSPVPRVKRTSLLKGFPHGSAWVFSGLWGRLQVVCTTGVTSKVYPFQALRTGRGLKHFVQKKSGSIEYMSPLPLFGPLSFIGEKYDQRRQQLNWGGNQRGRPKQGKLRFCGFLNSS